MVNMILDYIIARLQEASTIRNLILLVGGTWAQQHPEQINYIIPLAVALAGLIGSLLPDRLGKHQTRNTDPDRKEKVTEIKKADAEGDIVHHEVVKEKPTADGGRIIEKEVVTEEQSDRFQDSFGDKG